MLLDCGHHPACMYRYATHDKGGKRTIHKYCMACICEKSGIPEIGVIKPNEVQKEDEQPKQNRNRGKKVQ